VGAKWKKLRNSESWASLEKRERAQEGVLKKLKERKGEAAGKSGASTSEEKVGGGQN